MEPSDDISEDILEDISEDISDISTGLLSSMSTRKKIKTKPGNSWVWNHATKVVLYIVLMVAVIGVVGLISHKGGQSLVIRVVGCKQLRF